MDLADEYESLGAALGMTPSGETSDVEISYTHQVWAQTLDMFEERALLGLTPKSQVHQRQPTAWVRDKLRYELWSKQREIIESVRDNRQTAVHSAHAIGKSLTAAAAAMWWIDTHPVGEAFVITTAPTHAQVAAILWREMNRLHARGGLGGRMNLLEWYFGNELVAFGRKPADYDPDAFQGIHARYVLVVFDEACGIPRPLWDAASTLIANADSRFLAIGNPDDPHGEFARVCRPNSGWNVIHVAAEMTPNFTGEPVDELVAASLVSPEWVAEKALTWGVGSALYTSKVNGLFPTDSDKGVVPHSWATRCRYLQLPPQGVHAAGLDVGGGGDLTVLRERVGPKAGREETWNSSDPMEIVGEVALKLVEWGTERLVVDTIGLGWGVAGRLKELSRAHNPTSMETVHGAFVVGFNASERANQPHRFWNKRAELHWEVGRELSRQDAWDLENVDDDVIAELTEGKYEVMDSRGKVKVEPKELIRNRLGRSPDHADALLMAFWEGDSVEAGLPAPAQVLTGMFYDSRFEPMGPGWHGPRREVPVLLPMVGAESPEEEERVLRELQAQRPV